MSANALWRKESAVKQGLDAAISHFRSKSLLTYVYCYNILALWRC